MIPSRFCRKHPRVKAGWNCATCAADLCPECVATQSVGHRQAPVDVCCQCRRGVKPLTIHRAELIPFWQRVLDAPRFPLNSIGLISLVVLGFVFALTSYVGLGMMMMGGAVFLLRQGLFWAFMFFIIRHSAEGANKMGVLGLRDIHSDVITPAYKGLISTALLWLPAAIYIFAVSDEGLLGILSYEGHKDPVVWLLALFGIIYAPMALLAGATDMGFGEILNPIRIFSLIRRTGRDYFLAILSIAIVVVFGRIVDRFLASALEHIGLPFLPRWIAAIVSLYPQFIAARIMGVLLFTRGEALDWGRSEDYQVPSLPGVKPRGKLPEKPLVRESEKNVASEAEPSPAGQAAPRSKFDPQVEPTSSVNQAKQEERSIPLFGSQVGPTSSTGQANEELVSIPFFDPQVGPISASEPALSIGEPPPLQLAPLNGPPALVIENVRFIDMPGLPPPPQGPTPSSSPLMFDMPGLPPPPRGPTPSSAPVLEAHAFVEAQAERPVDLPAAFEEPAPVPLRAAPTMAPKPSVHATVRGFSPMNEQAAAHAPRPASMPDPSATRIGHESPLAGERPMALQQAAPVDDKNGPLRPLLRAIEEARLDEALRRYRDLREHDSAIPGHVHMIIGKVAAKTRDFEVAARAFGQVAFTQNEQAGAALVALAQVIGDGQNNLPWAKKLYREAIQRFPGTEVATFAERRLTALGSSG
jgi:hypothetical protein